MITSNAGAEFSTKTTIIVVLGWEPLKTQRISGLMRPVARPQASRNNSWAHAKDKASPPARLSKYIERSDGFC
jgi:hypothetical protein